MALGIDLGTQAVKVVLIDENGSLVGHGYRAYKTDYPRPGWVEQDPNQWWQAVRECVRFALAGAKAQAVSAIGVSGHMHSLLLMDQSFGPIRPVIVWADERSTEESELIQHKFGEDYIQYTKNPAATAYTATKLLWLRRHEPKSLDRTEYLMFPKDYLRWRLTGEWATDPSDASGSLLYDFSSSNWSETLVNAAGIRREILPTIQPSFSIAGELLIGAGEELGIRAGIPVVTGAGDLAAGLVGAGIIDDKAVCMVVGTAGQVMKIVRLGEDVIGRLHLFCHALPDTCFALGAVPTAGLCFSWMREKVLTSEGKPEPGYSWLEERAENVPPGSMGLLFLPFLLGTGTPYHNSGVGGAFLGLRPNHTQEFFVRAVMEGVAFALRNNFEIMCDVSGSKVRSNEIRLGGGGAGSRLWRRIIADVLGRPVRVLANSDASAVGCALMAAKAVGMFTTIEEACDVGTAEVIEPDSLTHEVYEECYGAYKEACRRLT